MSLDTRFQYTFASELPLPPQRDEETSEELRDRGLASAISLLHHPATMIQHDSTREFVSINPADFDAVDVVTQAAEFNVSLDPGDNPRDGMSEWKHYRVQEDVPILFTWTKQITFYTAIRCNKDGMEALSNPGSGVTIYGKWTVRQSDTNPHCLSLSEFADTHCNLVLSWYIKSTMQKTHDHVHAFIKEKFVEKMRGKQWK